MCEFHSNLHPNSHLSLLTHCSHTLLPHLLLQSSSVLLPYSYLYNSRRTHAFLSIITPLLYSILPLFCPNQCLPLTVSSSSLSGTAAALLTSALTSWWSDHAALASSSVYDGTRRETCMGRNCMALLGLEAIFRKILHLCSFRTSSHSEFSLNSFCFGACMGLTSRSVVIVIRGSRETSFAFWGVFKENGELQYWSLGGIELEIALEGSFHCRRGKDFRF
jgi:hypothetical protein